MKDMIRVVPLRFVKQVDITQQQYYHQPNTARPAGNSNPVTQEEKYPVQDTQEK